MKVYFSDLGMRHRNSLAFSRKLFEIDISNSSAVIDDFVKVIVIVSSSDLNICTLMASTSVV